MKNLVIAVVALFTIALGCQAQNDEPEFKNPLNIVVFTKTVGYRHESISAGLKMLYDQSKNQNWVITATENSEMFNDNFLSAFDVAVFLNPTGDVLNDEQQKAFETWMNSGKGFVGIHAAADCEYDWDYYDKLLGAHFKTHPAQQDATLNIENTDHPAMKPFKGMKTYSTYDEWYTFKENPRANVHVLASIDESSIKKFDNDNFRMGDHPLIWWQEKNGIRSFYSGFGHTNEAYQNKLIIEHFVNAINWAGKRIN